MSHLTITHHPATIHYFTETLGEGITMDLVLIPSGTFEMGSPEDELDRHTREGPQHTVTVPTFFMGRTPITQAQWRQVAQTPQVNAPLTSNPSRFKGDDRPVEQVSWQDATEFCARLSRDTRREYRLPSEAEWEYACRAGTTTPFHCGETISTDLANYDGKNYEAYGQGEKGIYRQETTDVGTFRPNPFGLYDMHGNVWEWCQDTWHDSYQNAPVDGSAWETGTSSSRVRRGGSWSYYPRNCRSAYRTYNNFGSALDDLGFRVVCCAP
jgi:formylglycine-generating enzyme required for sulfatase activity